MSQVSFASFEHNLQGIIKAAMDSDFLKAGNPNKIANAYGSFLLPNEVQKIRDESKAHTAAMYKLGLYHYKFAISLSRPHWRQKISRLYYASYNVSKSIRFDNDGNHSTDVKDHTKVGVLPNGFPAKSTYENELTNLREDRNSCDYDHVVKADKLLKSTTEYSTLVKQFLQDAHDYLTTRGITLGKKI